MSCLAEQAKILFAEAEEYNKPKNPAWARWSTCSLCEQQYHGFVYCALGWACWKTYLGRPEGDRNRVDAMNQLGNGLCEANCHEDALSVREAELVMRRRLGESEANILVVQGNLAGTYQALGRLDEATRMRRDVYFGRLRLNGKENYETLREALNYANILVIDRSEEAKTLLRTVIPVAQRIHGESHDLTLKMRCMYATALCLDTSATLDDLREAVTTLEDTEPRARRVLGGTHPTTAAIEGALQLARAALRAREGDVESLRDAVEAMTPG